MKRNCERMLLLCLCLHLWSWGERGGAPRPDAAALGARMVTTELGWRCSSPGETGTDKPDTTATPAPEATEPPAPETTPPPAPGTAATPAPEATATPAPEATATPAPATETTPPETETEPPEATATPAPAVDEPGSLPGEAPAEAASETELSPAATPRALRFPKDTVTNRTTGQTVDLEALRAEPLRQRMSAEGPEILILHTHATEAYTMDAEHRYTESDAYRCTDTAYNVVRVGDELAAALSEQGLRVIHDRTLYDYPSYPVSYSRSAAAVEQWLRLYPGIAVVIDVHRDAIGEGETVYKTRWEREGESAAQVMLLIGTGENGLAHPLWRENFKLALHFQDAMNAACPGLARPIDLVSERYNQHYTTGSMILEVGSSGNTLPEALQAVRSFGESVAPVLLGLRGK